MEEESSFEFFVDDDSNVTSTFRPLSTSQSLPFPLSADFSVKLIMVVYLTLNLLFGSLLRLNILLFTKTLNGNPINLFIWYDQLNGIFMGLNITYTLVVLYLPQPLSSLVGSEACNWTDLMGTFYIFGQSVWSSFIAIYRVLYIGFQSVFSLGVKGSRFVKTLSLVGHLFVISASCTFAYMDKGILYKLCAHQSIEQISILKIHTNGPNKVMFAMAYVGVVLNITEIISYLFLFRYLYIHDNTVAISVLKPEVIRVRNSRNAISLAGQLATWILESSYLLLLLFYMNLANNHNESSREMASIFKLAEFTLIPLAQVLTSPPLKNFVTGKN